MVRECWQPSALQLPFRPPLILGAVTLTGSAHGLRNPSTPGSNMNYSSANSMEGQNGSSGLVRSSLHPSHNGIASQAAAGSSAPRRAATYHWQSVPVGGPTLCTAPMSMNGVVGAASAERDSDMIGITFGPAVAGGDGNAEQSPVAILTPEATGSPHYRLAEGGGGGGGGGRPGGLVVQHSSAVGAPLHQHLYGRVPESFPYFTNVSSGVQTPSRWSPPVDANGFARPDVSPLLQRVLLEPGQTARAAEHQASASNTLSVVNGVGTPTQQHQHPTALTRVPITAGTPPGQFNLQVQASVPQQNGRPAFPLPHMTIAQPSGCFSYPAQSTTLPITAAPVTHVPGCNGLQPYLSSPIRQPVTLTTLTIAQPQFLRPGQAVQSPLSFGAGYLTPDSHLQHQPQHAGSGASDINDLEHDEQQQQQQKEQQDCPPVGFTRDEFSSFWNTPYPPNSQPDNVNGSNGAITETTPRHAPPSSWDMPSPSKAVTPATTPTSPPQSKKSKLFFKKQNPPEREFSDHRTAGGQVTCTVKAGQELEGQLSRMCPVHPRTRDIRIRRLERLPSHRRHFRCETCTAILVEFSRKHGLKPTDGQKKELLKEVGMTPTTLTYWFSNRRRQAGAGGPYARPEDQ